ncbi:MAG: DUF4870 domain-containing protein [Acidimicrobiia bacterium]
MTAPQPTEPQDVASDSRGWATAAHLIPLFGLGFIAPLIIWLIKRDEDPFVEDQAREALNFQLSLLLYGIGLMVLMLLSLTGIWLFAVLGIIGIIALGLFAFVFAIIAGIKSASGEAYRYPLIVHFVNPHRPTA